MSLPPDTMLTIPESEIRRHGPGRLLAICWRQWRAERALARRGITFRDTDPERVAAAYLAMTAAEFDAINAPQDWANWRTIPRALSGHVADRPLRVLDLGCGSGGSTRVLAFYCPAGSHITGYEFAEPLLKVARQREYRDRAGSTARVDFVCQGVTETWRDAVGSPLADESVDLVNSSGVIGHHLNVESIEPLVVELVRVLKPGGTAMLDVGPTLAAKELRAILEPAGFEFLGHYRSWFGDRTGEMLFRPGEPKDLNHRGAETQRKEARRGGDEREDDRVVLLRAPFAIVSDSLVFSASLCLCGSNSLLRD